jgi:hypothetical protein
MRLRLYNLSVIFSHPTINDYEFASGDLVQLLAGMQSVFLLQQITKVLAFVIFILYNF